MVFQNYALYPHMDARQEHGLRAQDARSPEERDRHAGPGGGAHPRPLRLAAQEAAHALRRAAPARRDGARHRPQSAGVPDGRAALEPRREAARGDARRDRAHPARPRRDDDLRHPRPDRGDDDGRSRRRDAKRVPPAGRRAEGALRAAAQPVRRRVHRLTGDEPRRRRGRAGGRRRLGLVRPAPAAPRAGRRSSATAASARTRGGR